MTYVLLIMWCGNTACSTSTVDNLTLTQCEHLKQQVTSQKVGMVGVCLQKDKPR